MMRLMLGLVVLLLMMNDVTVMAAEETKKETQRMVYWILEDMLAPGAGGDMKLLDGDIDKVFVLDDSQDDGKKIYPFDRYAGRPVDPTHLPRKMRVSPGRARRMPSIIGWSAYAVDEAFKQAVESVEPGVHQFEPLELVKRDGTTVDHRYWFFPCNRLDTVDEENTQEETEKYWGLGKDTKHVFSRKKIGEHHLWIDKFISPIAFLISNELYEAFQAAGLVGVKFNAYEESD